MAVALLGAIMGLMACAPPQAPSPSPTSAFLPSPPPTVPPLPHASSAPPLPTPPPSDVSDAVAWATEALHAALNIPTTDIAPLEVVPVLWSDSSLGCPQSNVAYTPAIVPGYRVILVARDQTYPVHTDLEGNAIVCLDAESAPGTGTAPDPIAAEFIMQARADLAARLSVTEDEVELVRSETVEWRDSSLGCAREGEVYLQVITPGYRLVFSVGGALYEYHTDAQRMIFCEAPTE